MGEIVLHLGGPKCGSSAVQSWLHDPVNLDGTGWTALVAGPRDGRPTVQLATEQPRANSSAVARLLRGPDGHRSAADFCEQLDEKAASHGRVVLSGEALAAALWRPWPQVLERLTRLGDGHDLRLVLYVRPQHRALEAHWRQWGFRQGRSPAESVRHAVGRGTSFDYGTTVHRLRRDHPGLRLDVRPYRRNLLDGGDIVVDFAGRHLGIDVAASPGGEVNRGLALDLINTLRLVDDDELWDSPHDNKIFNRVKALLADLEPMTEAAREGRRVLQSWAHERFAADNELLCELLDWDLGDFVPPIDAPKDLDLLDDLWAPPAAPIVVAALRRSLAAAVVERQDASR